MCDDAAKDDSSSVEFVPDWFVSQQQIDLWCDNDYWYNHDDNIECYEVYKRRKAQKVKIKEELVLIAWYLNRVMYWCMSKNEKRWWK